MFYSCVERLSCCSASSRAVRPGISSSCCCLNMELLIPVTPSCWTANTLIVSENLSSRWGYLKKTWNALVYIGFSQLFCALSFLSACCAVTVSMRSTSNVWGWGKQDTLVCRSFSLSFRSHQHWSDVFSTRSFTQVSGLFLILYIVNMCWRK